MLTELVIVLYNAFTVSDHDPDETMIEWSKTAWTVVLGENLLTICFQDRSSVKCDFTSDFPVFGCILCFLEIPG